MSKSIKVSKTEDPQWWGAGLALMAHERKIVNSYHFVGTQVKTKNTISLGQKLLRSGLEAIWYKENGIYVEKSRYNFYGVLFFILVIQKTGNGR